MVDTARRQGKVMIIDDLLKLPDILEAYAIKDGKLIPKELMEKLNAK